VDVWLDKKSLLPGQEWEYEIRKAVRESDVVVVCLSKQFNQAGFRQKEVRLALDTAMEQPEGEIFIIPARLEECDSLESLKKLHEVDLFDDDGYVKLMKSLKLRSMRLEHSGVQISKESKAKPAIPPKPELIQIKSEPVPAQMVQPSPKKLVEAELPVGFEKKDQWVIDTTNTAKP